MKRSQLQQIIKEEIQNVLKEYGVKSFDLQSILQGYPNTKPVDMKFFKEFLPKTAATVGNAVAGAKELEGQELDAHSMVYYVRDNATNKFYYLGHTQYYRYKRQLYGKPDTSGPQITLLFISELPEVKKVSDIQNAPVKNLDYYVVVDTKTFLEEMRTKPQLDIVKKAS